MNKQTTSKRREQRYPVKIPATVSLGKRGISGETRNVSYSGLYIATKTPAPLRSFIQIQLSLPNSLGPLELSAMVMQRRQASSGTSTDSGMGVMLYGNADEVLHRWNAFIATLSSKHVDSISIVTPPSEKPKTTIEMRNLSQHDLFRFYTINLPLSRYFIPTDTNLAIGDVVELTLRSPNVEESFPLKAQVIAQQRTPGSFGVFVSFIDITPETLARFWNFICNQTSHRYPPITLPTPAPRP